MGLEKHNGLFKKYMACATIIKFEKWNVVKTDQTGWFINFKMIESFGKFGIGLTKNKEQSDKPWDTWTKCYDKTEIVKLVIYSTLFFDSDGDTIVCFFPEKTRKVF